MCLMTLMPHVAHDHDRPCPRHDSSTGCQLGVKLSQLDNECARWRVAHMGGHSHEVRVKAFGRVDGRREEVDWCGLFVSLPSHLVDTCLKVFSAQRAQGGRLRGCYGSQSSQPSGTAP